MTTKGTVWFIGAGPGDPDLLTIKGQRLINSAHLVIYAGSLVPKAIFTDIHPDALLIDSAPLTLEENHAHILTCVNQGHNVARVHTGDPALFGTLDEQIALLEQDAINYEIVPGVSAAFAAAARAKISFTAPELGQSLIITRLAGRTPVPVTEQLSAMAQHNCSVAVYLSADKVQELQEQLAQAHVPAETPVLIAHAIGWPQESLFWATAATVADCVKENQLHRQTVFLILPNQNKHHVPSRLYAAEFSHGWRQAQHPATKGNI